MINPDYIIQIITMPDPCYPPFISRLLVIIPVIQRITPQLSGSRKSVRRASGNRNGVPFFIELEQFGISPCIGTVKGNIYRNITYYFNTLVVGILFKCSPLNYELILEKLIEFHFLGIFFSVNIKCFLIAFSDIFVPFYKAYSAEGVLDGHIQSVILKPETILSDKLRIIFVFCKIAASKCLFQHLKTCVIYFAVIYLVTLFSKII